MGGAGSFSLIAILQGRDNALGGGTGAFCFAESQNFHDLYITDNGGGASTQNTNRGQIGIYNVSAENGVYSNVQILSGTPMLFSQTNVLGIASPYQTLQTGCPFSMTGESLVEPTLVGSVAALPLVEANITNGFTVTGGQGVNGNAFFKFENTAGAAVTSNWSISALYEAGSAAMISTSVSLDSMQINLMVSSPAPGNDINVTANNLTISNSQLYFGHLGGVSAEPFITNTATGTSISGSILGIGGTTSAGNTTVSSSTIYAPLITPANITFAAGSNYTLNSSTGISVVGFLRSGNTVRMTSDFTSANSAALQVITGLAFTLPATAANYSFHCAVGFTQATNVAGDQFGVASLTTAPTALQINLATVAQSINSVSFGVLSPIASTTPTQFTTFTPAITTLLGATWDGTIEVSGSGASTLQFYVLNGTAADVIVVKKDSFCTLFPM
jgi:hypothetical protein